MQRPTAATAPFKYTQLHIPEVYRECSEKWPEVLARSTAGPKDRNIAYCKSRRPCQITHLYKLSLDVCRRGYRDRDKAYKIQPQSQILVQTRHLERSSYVSRYSGRQQPALVSVSSSPGFKTLDRPRNGARVLRMIPQVITPILATRIFSFVKICA